MKTRRCPVMALALLAALAVCPLSAAQGVHILPATVVPASVGYLTSVAAGDLDGDGHLDIAAATYVSSFLQPGVVILHGKSRGLFHAPDHHPDSSAHVVAIRDVTGDGLADVIAAGSVGTYPTGDTTVWVYPGVHGSTVADPVVSVLGPAGYFYWWSMAVGDIDKDGHLDLALNHDVDFDGSVRLAFGHGDGTFGRSTIVALDGSFASSLLLEDVDHDGHLDLVTFTNAPPGIASLLGDGTGAFGPQIPSDVHPFAYVRAIAAHDVDHDGFPDLGAMIADTDGSALLVLLRNVGAGQFEIQPAFESQHDGHAIGFRDLDGDGDADLVLAANEVGIPAGTAGASLIEVYQGLDDFMLEEPIRTEVGLNTGLLAFGDADDDGDEDVLLAEGPDVGIAFNLGDGHLVSTVHVASSFKHVRFRAADFNGDGHLDLAGTTGGLVSAKVTLALGTGPGALASPYDLGLPTGTGPAMLLAAHLNADPLPDLVYRKKSFSTAGAGLRVALATSGGTAFEAGQDLGGGVVADVDAVDLDGGGVLDLVATSSLNGLYTWSGLGDGTFAAPVLYPTSPSLRDIAVADFDGNGSPDLAVACDSPPTVFLYLNSPGAGLAVVELGTVPNHPTRIAAADLTGDGVLDLATAGPSIATIELLVGLGGATFAPPVSIPLPSGSQDLLATDMNGDDVQDLVVLSVGTTILLGKGGGRFHPPISSTAGTAARLEVADFDEDGFPDVVVADWDEILLLLNRAGP